MTSKRDASKPASAQGPSSPPEFRGVMRQLKSAPKDEARAAVAESYEAQTGGDKRQIALRLRLSLLTAQLKQMVAEEAAELDRKDVPDAAVDAPAPTGAIMLPAPTDVSAKESATAPKTN